MKLEAQVQELKNLARDRTQELETFNRSLTRRDELFNERETELAARGEANMRLREELDADRKNLKSRSLLNALYQFAADPMFLDKNSERETEQTFDFS
ncbi:hypothetical protein BPAE_0248g00150 [Botrytis paeoniae]|uniref:Uncharacterized protein n=1 Tax=Botrytis paeoniae TaxID=278948 RepID=A0A4Z1FCI0_9HELO|nr:hypothetical protein BPAE_0248g00150 [Botrytis paeoniae]